MKASDYIFLSIINILSMLTRIYSLFFLEGHYPAVLRGVLFIQLVIINYFNIIHISINRHN